MKEKGAPTKKDMREKAGRMERMNFEIYKLKVDSLIDSGITSSENIKEVRDYVLTYNASSDKYLAPKQKLIERIDKYQQSIK